MSLLSQLNDCCGYTTLRTVKLRDWRLGVLYYSFIFIVIAYIVGYNIVYQQLYRRTGDIVGTGRIQLRPPDRQYSVAAENTSFCGSGAGVPYKGPGSVRFQRRPCRYWDNYDAVYPSMEPAGAFVSTRVTETTQTLEPQCLDQPNKGCQFKDINNNTFFIADIEFSTALIDHMMIAPTVSISRSSLDMSGMLTDANGNEIDPCDDYREMGYVCPSYVRVGVHRKPDIVPVRTLLRAAGILSLDQRAGTLSTLENETLRYSGFVIILSIEYSNYFARTGSWFESTVSYRYVVTAVPNSEFKGEELLPNPGSGGLWRKIIDRHGIHMVIKQSGTVGTFDAAVLLISLTSALGLLAVVNTVVDLLATSLLPHRAVYAQYMQVQTVDFSSLRRMPPETLALFKREDLVNPAPPFLAVIEEPKDAHPGTHAQALAPAGVHGSPSVGRGEGGWARGVAGRAAGEDGSKRLLGDVGDHPMDDVADPARPPAVAEPALCRGT